MKFYFKAKAQDGQIKEGQVEAATKEAAIAVIQSNLLVPLELKEQVEQSSVLATDLQRLWEGVNLRELAVLFRQLATLVKAKVPIVTAIRAVQEQTENRYLQTVLAQVAQDVEDGLPLSESMAKHPKVFQALMISMVRAGEVSGNLQRSLEFLADNSEKNYELTAKIRSAMFYPAFVLGAAIAIGFLVLTFIIPKLTGVFAGLEVELPWYTQLLMTMGDFMQQWWWAVLTALLAAFGGGVYYANTADGKREWDQIKLKIPILGTMFRYIYISRFAENLGILMDGGIPIVRALIIVADVVGSDTYKSGILRAADEGKTGGAMSSVFIRSGEFPPIVSRMIKIGEEAGQISEVLGNVSVFYEREVDRMTRNLTTLIEPIMIVLLGIGVGILVIAVLMPIYNLSSMIK